MPKFKTWVKVVLFVLYSYIIAICGGFLGVRLERHTYIGKMEQAVMEGKLTAIKQSSYFTTMAVLHGQLTELMRPYEPPANFYVRNKKNKKSK